MDPKLATQTQSMRADLWVTSVLGVNAWLVIVLWPLAFEASPGLFDIALLLPPLVLLAAGVWQLRSRLPKGKLTAQWLLLAAFPVSVVAVVASRPEPLNQTAHTPLALLLGVVSLAAYGAGSASATARSRVLRHGDHQPLATAWQPDPLPRPWLRGFVMAVTLVGALCIAVLAPSWNGFQALESAWGKAAREGGVLTAVVAAILATTVVVVFLGPALRKEPARVRSAPERRRKVASLLLLSVVGGLTYWVITR